MADTSGRLASKRILYIDDDEDFALLTQWALGHFGHQVTILRDPAAALQTLEIRPNAWDFVIAALDTSDASGLDVARQLRRQHPELHCALVSHALSDDIVKAVAESGMGPLVRKPATMERFGELAELATH